MAVVGTISLPGDKSISHRALMIASMSKGKSKIKNLSTGQDVASTISCLTKCGVKFNQKRYETTIYGGSLRQPDEILDCGNSGTTMRLLSGLLAGQGIEATLIGDRSLSLRPMRRIIEPLIKMGVNISSNNSLAPLSIKKSHLNPIHHYSPIASAQVKSCILFAGLGADGPTKITEPILSRDHTEIMLKHVGANIHVSKECISISKSTNLIPLDFTIPSDPSTAAFFIAAAILSKDSKLQIKNVLLNETRSGFMKAIIRMGGKIDIQESWIENGEKIGNIEIRTSLLKSIQINKDEVPSIIDELPIFAIMATQAVGETIVSGAKELRIKESDRISTICNNLKLIGADVKELDDGFIINGPTKLQGASLRSFDDHRIAMGFSIADLITDGNIQLDNRECIAVSYPEFDTTIKKIVQ